MDLSFYPLTLEALDQAPGAQAEALCLFIAADERPLTGLAGLTDWRLSGRLSRLLRQGVLTGAAGEAVLTPPGTRLGFRKLFVFGLGPLEQGEAGLAERLGEALRKLAQAGVHEAAMQLPARLSIEAGIRTLVDELQGPTRALVFGPDPQKLVAALSKAASSAAQLERRVVKVPAPQKPPLPVIAKHTPPRSAAVTIPKASPLPFAPSGAPASDFTPAPPVPIPKASPLPFAPAETAKPIGTARAVEEGKPAQPVEGASVEPANLAGTASAVEPVAPAQPTEPAKSIEAARPGEASSAAGSVKPPEQSRPVELKPAPPPAQRFVPPPPKPHVFESGRHKGKGKKDR